MDFIEAWTTKIFELKDKTKLMRANSSITHAFEVDIIGIGNSVGNGGGQSAAETEAEGNGIGIFYIEVDGIVFVGKSSANMAVHE